MSEFNLKIKASIQQNISDKQIATTCAQLLTKSDFWSVANLLGEYYNYHPVSLEVTVFCKEIIVQIREFMGAQARTSQNSTMVVFGTSGWRGRIGEDFTVLNVHKVSKAIIDMMNSSEFLQTNQYSNFEEVKEKGIIVFRDNRFMGEEFMDAAMKELASVGIKIYLAGECPTGIGSALVAELKAAGSFNFTPSHNPMDYAGLKFNPADGGPADANLTAIIMAETVKYMKENSDFRPANIQYSVKVIDAGKIYINFLNKSKIFNIEAIKKYLKSIKNDLFLAIDNMHGSSRGYVQQILGEDLTNELLKSNSLAFVNTVDDYSFHGVKPEPSATNMLSIIKLAKDSGRSKTLVVALDPDGDRIRFGTSNSDIDMNKFGAIAYASLLDAGTKGPIASSLPTSDFALAIAQAEGQKIYETKVGFKWFRPYRDALLCFEESDGISTMGHTLEKDAIAGLLLALNVMMTTGKTIADYYLELQERYGFYYPEKKGVDVLGVSVEEWQSYKKNVLKALQEKLYKTGDSLLINNTSKIISRINIDDGLKITFEDNSWILLRPSGTEPKFRIYYEVTSKVKLLNPQPILEGYFNAGLQILDKARLIAASN
ncbi:MAG: phosphomannomutase [Candidatus Margulisbacteria bacterium]|nr:phosphomannomutase [Candidatus Margulisiibacteriota bacterium]